MMRLTTVVRFVALFALVLAASHRRAAPSEAMKGIAALVISGDAMRDTIRVGDFDTATGLYLRFLRGRVLTDSLGLLEGRRCVIISAFMANERNMNLRLEDLPVGRGDFNYQLYLFAPGIQPVMAAGPYVWRLMPEVAEEFAALGVPVSDITRNGARCEQVAPRLRR